MRSMFDQIESTGYSLNGMNRYFGKLNQIQTLLEDPLLNCERDRTTI